MNLGTGTDRDRQERNLGHSTTQQAAYDAQPRPQLSPFSKSSPSQNGSSRKHETSEQTGHRKPFLRYFTCTCNSKQSLTRKRGNSLSLIRREFTAPISRQSNRNTAKPARDEKQDLPSLIISATQLDSSWLLVTSKTRSSIRLTKSQHAEVQQPELWSTDGH